MTVDGVDGGEAVGFDGYRRRISRGEQDLRLLAVIDLTQWWAPMLAFAAGLVSFASPCVLPLVPGYLSFVSGAHAGAVGGSTEVVTKPALAPMLFFVAGFATVFTGLGAFAGTLVPVVRSAAGQRAAGAVVLVVGVILIIQGRRAGGAGLYADRRPFLAKVRPGKATAYPLGMAFAAGWTPCVGPVLAGTLALATGQGGAMRGALLLFAYSLGLGVPFVLLGLGVGRLMGALDLLKRHHEAISLVSGVIMVAIGLLLVSGLWVQVLSPLLRLVNRFTPPI